MSLTNFISLLGSAGSNVLKPKTHMLFSFSTGSPIGTGKTIGFFKIQDNGTLMYLGNDDPISNTLTENFQNVTYGYSPTKNQVVLWNKSYTNPDYRRHVIAYDVSDPDNPVRTISSAVNNSTGDGKSAPVISTEQVNATGVGTNAFFYSNANWRGFTTYEIVQFVGNGSANQIGGLFYNFTPISGNGLYNSPVLYDEDEGLFFATVNSSSTPNDAAYVIDATTRNSSFRFDRGNNPSDIAGIDKKRKLLFLTNNVTNAGVYRAYQKTVYCLDYSTFPITLRSHLDIGPSYYQSSRPRVLVHDDKFQYLLNIFQPGEGNPSSSNPGYYVVDTSDPDNLTQTTAARVAGTIDTRNFDYDAAQNTGYFFGNNNSNTGNYVHKFQFNASGVTFSLNVATDPLSTRSPADYLSGPTNNNATLLYG